MNKSEWNESVINFLEELRKDYVKNHRTCKRLGQYAKTVELIDEYRRLVSAQEIGLK